MTSFGPAKGRTPDDLVRPCKRFFRHYTPVVGCPPSEFGIQYLDELDLCNVTRLAEDSFLMTTFPLYATIVGI